MRKKFRELCYKFKFLRSLKVRLFMIIFMVGLLPCILMRFAILQNYEQRAVSVRTSDVQNQMKIIADHLITYNYLQDPSSEVVDAELEQISNLYNGRILIIGPDLKIIKDTYGVSEGKTIISEEVIKCLKNQASSSYDRENGYIEVTTPIVAPSDTTAATQSSDTADGGTAVEGVLLTGVSTDTVIATKDILSRKAVVVEAIVIFIVLFLAVFWSVHLVRPFEKMTKAIGEVKAGFTNDPIVVRDYTETEHICDAFNNVLARMKALDDSREEFVSDVSHELKTPITSMKVLADSLTTQQDVPVETYREFMQDMSSEIDREDRIINDLLALVRMDKSATELNISQIDMNVLVELVLKRLSPIARKRDVELVFESIRPVTAAVEEEKMTQVITNLVENAIKYNKEHGWVKVTLDADHQFFTIKVADSGIGIPEESISRIYERFYRVDKSRSREIGGTGLGLSITRNAILMHRGSIKVESTENVGTTFTVKIPLTYISG